MTRIYLDHNATSPLRPEAKAAMATEMEIAPANPSSTHAFGHRARMTLETSRARLALMLDADPGEIVFTGGGTEANNLAIYGAALAAGPGARLVTSSFEHPSVLEVMADLEERGYDVVRVAPLSSGTVDPDALLRAAGTGTALVSLMLANNEIGSLQPVAEVGRELHRRGVLFHSDACQALGKIPVSTRNLSVDLLSVAAHKLGGPQGVGALYVRSGVTLRPHLRGGGQELHRRPGTENVFAVSGFGAAAEAAARNLGEEGARMLALRARLESRLTQGCPEVRINGSASPRLPNTISLACAGASAETVVVALDLEGIAVSAGAACSAGAIRRSPALEAMGLPDEAGCSIRLSLGPETTVADVDRVAETMAEVLQRVRGVAIPSGSLRT